MDPRSQNDSDVGEGHRGPSPNLRHDERRPLPRPRETVADLPDAGQIHEQASQAPAVLSLDQIRISGSCNEYTEGPTVTQRSPASLQKTVLRTSGQQETHEERSNNLHNLRSSTLVSSREVVVQSSSVEDSQSSIRISVGSTSSGQRLITPPLLGDQIIRAQPKRADLNSDELKPLSDETREVVVTPGTIKIDHKHPNRCESCGRCQCPACTRVRVLPSCWMCGRRCVCSAQSVVEYGTCICCVKGLFYHCSSDDEDTCADKPFSCTQSHCCVRWTAVSLLSLLFPCLLCYLPAKCCVAACQSCYDRASRPGCRCKRPVRCEDVGKLT